MISGFFVFFLGNLDFFYILKMFMNNFWIKRPCPAKAHEPHETSTEEGTEEKIIREFNLIVNKKVRARGEVTPRHGSQGFGTLVKNHPTRVRPFGLDSPSVYIFRNSYARLTRDWRGTLR